MRKILTTIRDVLLAACAVAALAGAFLLVSTALDAIGHDGAEIQAYREAGWDR